MARHWSWLGAAALALFLATSGCEGTNPVGPDVEGEDAGGGQVGEDAGVEADGGTVESDGGATETDAGVDTDGGAETDAGSVEADGGSVDPDGGVTPRTICQDVAKKRCDFYIRCRTDAEDNQGRPNAAVSASERAACEAREADVGCESLAASWDAGRSIVDQAAYLDCIDTSYPAGTCARDSNALLTACGNLPFLTPNTAAGGSCILDNECQSGYCDIPANQTCGTCRAYVGVGQPCTGDRQCNPALHYCDDLGFNPPRVCTAFSNTGTGCQNDRECGANNVCAFTGTMFNRECRPAKQLGEGCTGGRFECFRVHGNLVGTTDLPETICNAQDNQVGTCVKLVAATNSNCGNAERLMPIVGPRGPVCQDTDFCQLNTCKARLPAGQTCQNDDMCAFGTRCVSNVCTAYLDVGATCTGTAQCMNLLSCQTGKCASAIAELGESCSTTAPQLPCAEGYCDTGTSTCVPARADGQACTAPEQCASSACVGGLCAAACWR